MKNNKLLLFAGSLLVPMMAMAGPRSFQQAKAIAQKQAAKIGAAIDEQAAAKARKRRTAIIASLVLIALLLIAGSVYALTRGASTAEPTAVPNVVGLSQTDKHS